MFSVSAGVPVLECHSTMHGGVAIPFGVICSSPCTTPSFVGCRLLTSTHAGVFVDTVSGEAASTVKKGMSILTIAGKSTKGVKTAAAMVKMLTASGRPLTVEFSSSPANASVPETKVETKMTTELVAVGSTSQPKYQIKPEDRPMLNHMFETIDSSGDGNISRSEVIKFFRQESFARGQLSKMLHIPDAPIKQEDGSSDKFEQCFQEMDDDDSKNISKEEFVNFVCSLSPDKKNSAKAVGGADAKLLIRSRD